MTDYLGQQGDINRLTTERDGAYRERAHLLALLAALHPSVIAPAPDVDEDGWQILYLHIGGKQASWHIAPRDADLCAHVEHVPADDRRAQWDGHTTEQKYTHIGQHASQLYAEARSRVETPADEQYRYATTWAEYRAGRAALDKPGVDDSSPAAPDLVHPHPNQQVSEPDKVDEQSGPVDQDVTRVVDLYKRWLKAGPPPLGTSTSRWWDARLAELYDAIRPHTADQPKEK